MIQVILKVGQLLGFSNKDWSSGSGFMNTQAYNWRVVHAYNEGGLMALLGCGRDFACMVWVHLQGRVKASQSRLLLAHPLYPMMKYFYSDESGL